MLQGNIIYDRPMSQLPKTSNGAPLVAVITGAASGMGEAFARRLAKDGAIVALLDINLEHASNVADEIGGLAIEVDVADSGAFDAAVDAVVAEHGHLDILINNAGIAPPTSDNNLDTMVANQIKRFAGDIAGLEPINYLVQLSDQDWDRMIKVHLYGTFYGCRAALRHMIPARSGSIVNISSVLGQRHSAAAPHYAAAKAGIISLTKSVAEESSGLGVRVNAVCPGYIDTPLIAPFSDRLKTMITSRIGIGRMGTAEELAELVRFLCGPESSYCTGDIFTASGGYN